MKFSKISTIALQTNFKPLWEPNGTLTVILVHNKYNVKMHGRRDPARRQIVPPLAGTHCSHFSKRCLENQKSPLYDFYTMRIRSMSGHGHGLLWKGAKVYLCAFGTCLVEIRSRFSSNKSLNGSSWKNTLLVTTVHFKTAFLTNYIKHAIYIHHGEFCASWARYSHKNKM